MTGLLMLFLSSVMLSPELLTQLEILPDNEKITVIVVMNSEYPFDAVKNFSIKERAEIFKEIARKSQKDLIDYLNMMSEDVEQIKQFWVFNGMHITATKRIIKQLTNRNDIKYILHNETITILPHEIVPDSRTPEWNISKVMADSCWYAGYTGDGIYIGHLDTGCDFNHPALTGNFSGYWRDCVNGQTQPYDDNGHGIFSAGIICGGDGLGPFTNDIGVAPDAKLICAKTFNSYGSGQYAWVDEGMQWIADLKTDSGVDIRAVSNSWGSSRYDLHYWNMCLTWKSIGILGLWSIGSSGPGQGTCVAPGNYPLVLGSGATDSNDFIPAVSCRGPAPDSPPWNDTIYWYRRDWNLIKPEIIAPGMNIRSSYRDGGYATMNGTSWTNPHVAGGVAILCDAGSNLTNTQLYNLILDYADRPSHGAPYPNNTYGWGRLNIWRTLQAVLNIEERNKDNDMHEITIRPTICRGQLRIDSGTYKVALFYDISGRMVFSAVLDKNNIITLPESLKNGIYFVKINYQSHAVIEKIVLMR